MKSKNLQISSPRWFHIKVENKPKLELELKHSRWDLQRYNNEGYVTCKNKLESFYKDRTDHGYKK